ncbi:MAG: DNA polymerase III subunit delta [Bacteroidales bacterium]|jgi:DNA polymerase-3 subunit delta|nr:DNA polymerase III subunit delta [Bacteroidales bacterium]
MTFEEILSKLQKKEFAPLYLLMGEEPFFIDQLSDYLEENVMPEVDRDFNQMLFYANDKEVDAVFVIAAAREFPFGVPYRMVIIKEAKGLKNIDLLKDYAANPSPATILVICHKYGKLKAAQYKPFEKNGIVFTSEKIKDNKLASWVQSQATQHQFSMDVQSANIVAESIGNDLTRINNELLKLKIFLPEGSKITPDIVERYIGISKEYNVFELQTALGERNNKKSTKIALNLAQNSKENPIVKIVAVLYPFFHRMLAYHLAPDHSKETMAAIYGNMHPYVQQLNISYAQRYTVSELQKIISLFREFDLKAKGVNNNSSDEELIKELVLRVLG